jgi:hypothetical protein
MKKFSIAFLFAFIAMQLLCHAQNSQENIRPSWIYLYGGISIPNISTDVTIDSKELGASTTLNLEDELKFPDHPSLFYFKTVLGTRAQFVFSILNVKRDGDNYITRSITFADSTYHAGALVHSYFNTVYYSGTFRYAILYNPNASAGLSLGMRWMNISAGLTATSNGATVSRNESMQVPVFLPGVFGSVQIIPSLYGRISAEYLKVNIKDAQARVLEAQISGEYYFLRNVGAGVAYSITNFKADNLPENDVSIRNVRYSLNGFSFFAALKF